MSTAIIRKDQKYSRIEHDITNYCNLRCKFCCNCFLEETKVNMSDETLKKTLQLIPLVKDRLFLLSCGYELTLHPDFTNFLGKIPYEAKEKCFFTTNLAKPLTDEQLKLMLSANVCFINISLETFDRELYKRMMQVKNSNFYENLERLSSIYKTIENPAKIRFVTMVLKDNFDELEDIVKELMKCLNHLNMN